MRLSVPDLGIERSYSMATAVTDWPCIRFLIRLIPGGAMSDALVNTIKPGDKVSLEGPFGQFYLHAASDPMLWIAGGTGLAPFLSMLSTLRHQGKFDAKITLCLGVNSVDDLCWPVGFKTAIASFAQLDLRVAIKEPPPGWQGVVGSVLDCLNAQDWATLAPTGTRAYLCGPPGMVSAAQQRLDAAGVAPTHVHSERFEPSLQSEVA